MYSNNMLNCQESTLTQEDFRGAFQKLLER